MTPSHLTAPESRRVAERFRRLKALGCIDQPTPKRTYRTMSITEKLKQAALAHPLDADQSLYSIAAAHIEEQQAKLSRLTKAASAMRQEIVNRIEPDDEGFQPYDGNLEIWNEFCDAMEAAKV